VASSHPQACCCVCREAEREKELVERAEFEERLRAKDSEERKRRHGGKRVEEEHKALDAGLDAKGRARLMENLRVLSEQQYLEKRQDKQLEVRVQGAMAFSTLCDSVGWGGAAWFLAALGLGV
jgi:hypothetical protein